MNRKQFCYALYQLTRASFLAQEKNSSLGMFWHVLNPLLMSAVLYAVFSQFEHFQSINNFLVFILIGLTHYNFFLNTTTRSANYFLTSRSLILNTTMPLEMLVLRQIGIEGATLIVEVILIIIIAMFMGVVPNAALTYYPLIFVCVLMLGMGASLFLCGLVVFLTDLNYIWQLFCRVLFFITPVFYTAGIVGEGFARTLIDFNPLSKIIILARASLLRGEIVSSSDLGLAMAGSFLVLIIGFFTFRAVRPRIPDYI